jgi:hypothetical protein
LRECLSASPPLPCCLVLVSHVRSAEVSSLPLLTHENKPHHSDPSSSPPKGRARLRHLPLSHVLTQPPPSQPSRRRATLPTLPSSSNPPNPPVVDQPSRRRPTLPSSTNPPVVDQPSRRRPTLPSSTNPPVVCSSIIPRALLCVPGVTASTLTCGVCVCHMHAHVRDSAVSLGVKCALLVPREAQRWL